MPSISVLNTDAGLSGDTIVTIGDNQTITSQKTFDRDPSAPFVVTAGSAVVTNLDADTVDGIQGADLLNTSTTRTANTVFAGPVSGSAAAPTFRALVTADLTSAVSVLDRDVTVTTVASTGTETTVYSFSVPGGTLGSTKQLRLTMIGDQLQNGAGGDNLTVKVKYGATTIYNGVFAVSQDANRRAFHLETILSALASTGAQISHTTAKLGAVSTVAGVGVAVGATQTASHASIAEDSTAAKTLSITVQQQTSDANISFRAHVSVVELLN